MVKCNPVVPLPLSTIWPSTVLVTHSQPQSTSRRPLSDGPSDQQQPNATSRCYIIQLTSWRHGGAVTISRHHRQGEYSTERYSERPHSVTLITVCCYCSSSLLVTAVNLLLCLTYKLSAITDSMDRKKKNIYSFRYPRRVLERVPQR